MVAPIHPIPLAEFRGRVQKIYRSAAKAPKTMKQLDHVLRLAEAAGVETTDQLTTEAMSDIILARGDEANANTTRGLISRLGRCCCLAARLRLIDRDDLPDWESLRPRKSRPVRNAPHSPQDVSRLLAGLARCPGWFGARLHALASLVACTGLRRNEALFARVVDLDLVRGFVFVVPRSKLKTEASAAPVPLPDELVPTLKRWLPDTGGTWLFPGARSGGPWTGGAPGYRPLDRLRAAGDELGIAGVGFHSLRHTLATQLMLAGTPAWAIQRILRHTTPMTTAHYLHPTDLDVARLVRGFRYPA